MKKMMFGVAALIVIGITGMTGLLNAAFHMDDISDQEYRISSFFSFFILLFLFFKEYQEMNEWKIEWNEKKVTILLSLFVQF